MRHGGRRPPRQPRFVAAGPPPGRPRPPRRRPCRTGPPVGGGGGSRHRGRRGLEGGKGRDGGKNVRGSDECRPGGRACWHAPRLRAARADLKFLWSPHNRSQEYPRPLLSHSAQTEPAAEGRASSRKQGHEKNGGGRPGALLSQVPYLAPAPDWRSQSPYAPGRRTTCPGPGKWAWQRAGRRAGAVSVGGSEGERESSKRAWESLRERATISWPPAARRDPRTHLFCSPRSWPAP